MSDLRTDTTLDALLDFVKETRGFDFTGYKRSTIQRRVAKRMAAVGVERYDDYVDFLELHGEEFAELFNTLLINTTGFRSNRRQGAGETCTRTRGPGARPRARSDAQGERRRPTSNPPRRTGARRRRTTGQHSYTAKQSRSRCNTRSTTSRSGLANDSPRVRSESIRQPRTAQA